MNGDAASAAERLLSEAGIHASVVPGGHDGSVARIHAPRAAWPRLVGPAGAALAERIRDLGFRYVAIDLDGVNGDDIDDET